MTRGAAPAAVLPLVGGLAAVAFLSWHPLVIGSVAVAGALLLRAAATGPGPYVAFGVALAVFFALLNPFVTNDGNLILVAGPHTPILDLEVTLEEVVFGAVSGVRVLAVALLTGAALGLVDADRLLARAMRFTPRSALTTALAVRLLPTLRRDASAVHEAARLRGLSTAGPRRAVLRRWAPLLVPLTASSLERGLDQAEAMTARGFAAGRRSHRPEATLTRRERAAAVLGVVVVLLAAVSAVRDVAPYAYYPRLAAAGDAEATALGVAVLAVAAAGAAVLTRRR